jgi:CheY-like chemotaxis protein
MRPGALPCDAEAMLRCLIVDDSPRFLDAARGLLERQGITVVGVASNSAEALQRAQELRPDVTLLYFRLAGPRATAQELEELAADAGAADIPGAGEQIVARLDPASRAREGQKLELWFDPRKLHLFNPSNGTHLTL